STGAGATGTAHARVRVAGAGPGRAAQEVQGVFVTTEGRAIGPDTGTGSDSRWSPRPRGHRATPAPGPHSPAGAVPHSTRGLVPSAGPGAQSFTRPEGRVVRAGGPPPMKERARVTSSA